MPINYAIFLVAALYLVGGLFYVEWIYRPRKLDQTKPLKDGTHEGERN